MLKVVGSVLVSLFEVKFIVVKLLVVLRVVRDVNIFLVMRLLLSDIDFKLVNLFILRIKFLERLLFVRNIVFVEIKF